MFFGKKNVSSPDKAIKRSGQVNGSVSKTLDLIESAVRFLFPTNCQHLPDHESNHPITNMVRQVRI